MHIEYKLTDGDNVQQAGQAAQIKLAMINWIVEHGFENRYREIKINIKTDTVTIHFPDKEFYSIWALSMPPIMRRDKEAYEFKIIPSPTLGILKKILNAFRN